MCINQHSFAQVTGVQILWYTGSFAFGHDVQCLDWRLFHIRGAVFHMRFLAGTAQYLLNHILRRIMDYNCQLWRIGMIHVRV